ncbi:MAG TPA: flagellar motor protein MotB [Candidimonas sp.]|nr:flagellar motor protein MotB [Candidimonas sp.]
MSNSEPRIVIRRRRPRHEAPHGGSWKIAYADFMTAMMAFFLVMWLVSLVPQKDLQEMAEYFRMPLMEAITGGQKNDSGSTVIPGGSPSIIPNPHLVPSRGDVHTEGDLRDARRLENLKADIEQLIKTDPILTQFRPQLLLDMTPDGLRVQIIDKHNRPMFTTGSAQVQSYMRDILRRLGPIFNELPNSISVAGHTDDIQYASGEREYSNWELSADRANAARKELVGGGMDETKVKRILGLSSSVSLIKDNPTAAVNRRISIVVLNRQAERRIDEQNASGTTAFDLKDIMEPASVLQLTVPGMPVLPVTPSLP